MASISPVHGSSTIAVPAAACASRTPVLERALGDRLQADVERQLHGRAVEHARVVHAVDQNLAPQRIALDLERPRERAQILLVDALDAFDATQIDPGEAEHLGGGGPVWIEPARFGDLAEPADRESMHRSLLARRHRALQPDEIRLAGELRRHGTRQEAECGAQARLRTAPIARADLPRTHVQRGPLDARRQRLAVPVQNGAAMGSDVDLLVMLAARQTRQIGTIRSVNCTIRIATIRSRTAIPPPTARILAFTARSRSAPAWVAPCRDARAPGARGAAAR